MGIQMSLLDIGGGFCGLKEFQLNFEECADVTSAALDEFFPPDSRVQIIAEPGRYYVESAFTLAANVFGKKVVIDTEELNGGEDISPGRKMMYYLNDGLHGSISCLIHDSVHSVLEPYPHRAVDSSEQRFQSVIWGPTCHSLDKVKDNYWLPELHVGDWLLIDNMGAYSVSLVSDFNGFERAHVHTVVSAKTWQELNLSLAFSNTEE